MNLSFYVGPESEICTTMFMLHGWEKFPLKELETYAANKLENVSKFILSYFRVDYPNVSLKEPFNLPKSGIVWEEMWRGANHHKTISIVAFRLACHLMIERPLRGDSKDLLFLRDYVFERVSGKHWDKSQNEEETND